MRIVDHQGFTVWRGRTRREGCAWWAKQGEVLDRFAMTGELVSDVDPADEADDEP